MPNVARRSASNERYGKNTAPAGKTRKSASAAKPKRANASGAAPSKSGKSSKAAVKKRPPVVYNPNTPEYKKWRSIWWGFLGLAVVLTTASFFLMPPRGNQQQLGVILLGTGYAAIAASLYLDFTKLRKMREEWMKSGQAAEAGAAVEKARETKAAEKAAAKAAEAAAKSAGPHDASSD